MSSAESTLGFEDHYTHCTNETGSYCSIPGTWYLVLLALLRCRPSNPPSTPLVLESRFGGKPVKFQVVCPQNGTAVLKGWLNAPATYDFAGIKRRPGALILLPGTCCDTDVFSEKRFKAIWLEKQEKKTRTSYTGGDTKKQEIKWFETEACSAVATGATGISYKYGTRNKSERGRKCGELKLYFTNPPEEKIFILFIYFFNAHLSNAHAHSTEADVVNVMSRPSSTAKTNCFRFGAGDTVLAGVGVADGSRPEQ